MLISPFSHITKEKILQLLWSITLFTMVQMTSNLVQKHVILGSSRQYQNSGEIDHTEIMIIRAAAYEV